MRRLTAFCFLLTSASCFAHAAASQVARDSVRADSLGEVTVTAARVALSTHRAPSRVTVLGREALDASGGTSAADVLEDRSAVFLNVHKHCAAEVEARQPLEAFRVAALLSRGALVVSQVHM